DVIRRNTIALLQERQERQPRFHLLRAHRIAYVGIVADELDAKRIGLDDAAIGFGVVNIFVVVAIGAVAVGRNRCLGSRPVDGALDLYPDGNTALGGDLELLLREAVRAAGRAFGLVDDDVFPVARFLPISERVEVDDLEVRDLWLAWLLGEIGETRGRRLRGGSARGGGRAHPDHARKHSARAREVA